MSGHTPGPFKRNNIVESDFMNEVHEVDIYDVPGDQVGTAFGKTEAEALANADLFAAAPDVLAALKAWLDHLSVIFDAQMRGDLDSVPMARIDEIIKQAHAAVARGEKP